MTCRSCGAGLEQGRIDAKLGVVTCSHCGSLHDVPSVREATATSSSSGGAAVRERAEAALPDGFKVKRGEGSLEVIWPVGSRFGGVVLCVIAAATVYMAVSSGTYPLLIATVGILYFAAVQSFNAYRLRVDRARIDVAQAPLPWKSRKSFASTDIQQLFAKERETRIQTDNESSRKVEIRKSYQLVAKTREGRQTVILNGLADASLALWLEQEIEQLLGIGDTAVAGSHIG